MAFTRFHDDPARVKKQLQESTDPGRWMVNVPGNGTHPGFSEDPYCRLQKWGGNLRTNVVDLQSDLMGLTRNLNRDCVRNNMYEQYEAQSEKMNFKSHKPFVDETLSVVSDVLMPVVSVVTPTITSGVKLSSFMY